MLNRLKDEAKPHWHLFCGERKSVVLDLWLAAGHHLLIFAWFGVLVAEFTCAMA